MPVLRYVPQDPTEVVMQGEQMRQAVFDPIDLEQPTAMIGRYFQSGLASIVQDDDAFSPMNSFVCQSIMVTRRQKNNEMQRRVNAGISTPCGAWVPNDWPPMLIRFEQSSETFTVNGQTVTGAGAPLGGVRVVVYETGRMAVSGASVRTYYSTGNPSPAIAAQPSAVVAEAISDGSGNFSIAVPMNVAYQLTGYLTGSPDRAGVTREDVVPTTASTLIYLRDPTSPDGPGGSAAYRPIGSPVVRRLQ